MRPLAKRIDLLKFLGQLFRDISSDLSTNFYPQSTKLKNTLPEVEQTNPWFTPESVLRVFKIWGETLTDEAINSWLSSYNLNSSSHKTKKVMVIMAGNIPLVGFHDFLCTIISGHIFWGKLSSRDKILFPLIRDWILEFDDAWKDYIKLDIAPKNNAEVVIATGSNNTSRLIKELFSNKPLIIRHNRNSIALITGDESELELQNLSFDILWYYGLGCRNISLLWVPDKYDLTKLVKIIQDIKMDLPVVYENNLKYQRAKAVMHKIPVYDADKLLFIENPELDSSLGTLHFTRYKNTEQINLFQKLNTENIQCSVCSVGNMSKWNNTIGFGKSQKPDLMDYADGIDTVQFLINLQ